MPYREISDLRVSAYAPVSARLMRNLRDNALGVGRFYFAGFGDVEASRYNTDPDTATNPPVVFYDVEPASGPPGTGDFSIDVPPALTDQGDGQRCRLSIYVSFLALTGTGIVAYRVTDGTLHSDVYQRQWPPLLGTTHRFEWNHPIPAPGLKQFKFQAAYYVVGSLIRTVIGWDAALDRSFLTA